MNFKFKSDLAQVIFYASFLAVIGLGIGLYFITKTTGRHSIDGAFIIALGYFGYSIAWIFGMLSLSYLTEACYRYIIKDSMERSNSAKSPNQ